MSYVVYHKESTRILKVCKPGHIYGRLTYETEGAAKAAITREAKKGKIEREDYAVAESSWYTDNIEQKEKVRNLMSGKEVTQSVNTPLCCDPSSETYWSM